MRVIRVLVVGLLSVGLLIPTPSQRGVAKSLGGGHCGDAGPIALSASWCGCTWGAVVADGVSVSNADIKLSIGGQTITRTTALASSDPFPIYDLHADVISATYGSLATVTASYQGNTLTRTVRLVPNINGEQLLNFVFPQDHHWEKQADIGVARGLVLSGTTLWIGTPAGPVLLNTATNVSSTLNTGLSSASVQAIAVAPNGHVFVGTASGLSQFDGTAWTAQNLGLAVSNVRALAIAPNGDVWAGVYGASGGGLSRFDGTSWQVQSGYNTSLSNLVTALQFDSAGNLWVGTDDAGVSRWNGSAWQTFGTADGLASKTVTSLAAEPGAMWIGTLGYLTAGGTFGGVSRYVLATGKWTTYNQASGLASNNVTSIVIDNRSRKWFGTGASGISRFDNQNWNTFTDARGLGANAIRALAAGPDGTVWAGSSARVDRWAPGTGSTPPTVSQPQVRWSPTHELAFSVTAVAATATDTDSGIRSLEWRSDISGDLGTEITFTLRAAVLQGGTHTISVRAIDNNGVWSAPVSTSLTINRVLLPITLRS